MGNVGMAHIAMVCSMGTQYTHAGCCCHQLCWLMIIIKGMTYMIMASIVLVSFQMILVVGPSIPCPLFGNIFIYCSNIYCNKPYLKTFAYTATVSVDSVPETKLSSCVEACCVLWCRVSCRMPVQCRVLCAMLCAVS